MTAAAEIETFAAHALSTPERLAAVLDHTLLKPEATEANVLQLCQEAAEYRFACAMVNPTWCESAVAALKGTGVAVGVVVGFPLGANLAISKQEETRHLLALGAHDIDMVLNIGRLRSGTASDLAAVESDIRSLADLAHDAGAILKVILETCLLSFEQKLRAADLALHAGADFLKTSTGFSTAGATVEDITLLYEKADGRAQVKASGGIRSLADTAAMLRAGASRIGASASVRIVSELAAHLASQGNAPHTVPETTDLSHSQPLPRGGY